MFSAGALNLGFMNALIMCLLLLDLYWKLVSFVNQAV